MLCAVFIKTCLHNMHIWQIHVPIISLSEWCHYGCIGFRIFVPQYYFVGVLLSNSIIIMILLMWSDLTILIPVIIGALESVPSKLKLCIEKIGIKSGISSFQKFVLLGITNIL